MRRPVLVLLAGLAAMLVAIVGCRDDYQTDLTGFRLMVPNAPGSGYDLTARTAAKTLEDAKILRDVEVFNLPGSAGLVGLHRLVNERGNGRLAMLMGLGMIGSLHTNRSESTLTDTTPIARLLEEPEIVVVTRDS